MLQVRMQIRRIIAAVRAEVQGGDQVHNTHDPATPIIITLERNPYLYNARNPKLISTPPNASIPMYIHPPSLYVTCFL